MKGAIMSEMSREEVIQKFQQLIDGDCLAGTMDGIFRNAIRLLEQPAGMSEEEREEVIETFAKNAARAFSGHVPAKEVENDSGVLKVDEVTLEFFRKYLCMPNATLEELCREAARLKLNDGLVRSAKNELPREEVIETFAKNVARALSGRIPMKETEPKQPKAELPKDICETCANKDTHRCHECDNDDCFEPIKKAELPEELEFNPHIYRPIIESIITDHDKNDMEKTDEVSKLAQRLVDDYNQAISIIRYLRVKV